MIQVVFMDSRFEQLGKLKMELVPRVGDNVSFDPCDVMMVASVCWFPDEDYVTVVLDR